MEALKSTVIHTLEIAVALTVAYLAMSVFNVNSEVVTGIVGLVLASAAKFARASDSSSVPDYVNN